MNYLAVGNNEIKDNPELGNQITCEHCGKIHDVENGEKVNDDGTKEPSNKIQFYKCGDKTYMCGIDGIDIRDRFKG